MRFDWLIVGAGFSGAVLAERLATQLDHRVLVIDRRDHIGGNAYDHHDEAGILVHRYGPHIFHTNSQKVWQYLSRFTAWRPYFHRSQAVVDGKCVPIPFNLNAIRLLFSPAHARRLESSLLEHYEFGAKVPVLRLREHSEPDLRWLADFVYEAVFENYTFKQWGLKPEQLDASVTARVPIMLSRDDRYFQDRYQAMPAAGYTELIRRLLSDPRIKIMLKTDYSEVKGMPELGRVVFTGPIDEFFDRCHGALPYRSLRFEMTTLSSEWHQKVATITFPNNYDYTRTTEFKHLTGQIAPRTTIVNEFAEPYVPGQNEPYYPIPRAENRELYGRYRAQAEQVQDRVLFAGRLGEYKYYNMDQAVAASLALFEQIVRAAR